MKIYILMVVAGVLILAGLTIDKLSSDAVGMALGVIFGVLAFLPTALLGAAANRRREPEERIVIVERPVYRVATMEPETPKTAQLADDLIDWDCFDAQAQVQLGMYSQRRIAERGNHDQV